jgi:hypothetical protein
MEPYVAVGGGVTLNEVADLIISPQAETLLRGNYVNKRGVRGYFVQIKCGNHWCKVSVSNAEHHSARITVEELEGIDSSMLQPAALVPSSSISEALKSRAAQDAPVNTYLNSAEVEGIWAEFRHAANWYMVSVSHIDVPTYAKSEELERIADEFLLQQGFRKLSRRYRQGR